jgi:hypothetical protein
VQCSDSQHIRDRSHSFVVAFKYSISHAVNNNICPEHFEL